MTLDTLTELLSDEQRQQLAELHQILGLIELIEQIRALGIEVSPGYRLDWPPSVVPQIDQANVMISIVPVS